MALVATVPHGMHVVEETMAINFPKWRDISRTGTSAFTYVGCIFARDHTDNPTKIVEIAQRSTVANGWFPAYSIHDDSLDIHLVRSLP